MLLHAASGCGLKAGRLIRNEDIGWVRFPLPRPGDTNGPVVAQGRSYWPLLLVFALPACDKLTGGADDSAGEGDGSRPIVADVSEGAATLVEPLTRGAKRLRFIGKGSDHLGWKLSAIAKMYSLAGAVEVPQWGPEGTGALRQTRDGDLQTAWTCQNTREQTCAFGIHFPKPTTLVAIRVNASPDMDDKPGDFARVRTLRVHTDEGYAEARFEPTYAELFLKLGEPVTTTQLTVEVVETNDKEGGLLRIAEFDAFGTKGDPRPPLEVDSAATFVQLSDPVWKKSGTTRELEPSWIEYLGADGRPRTLAAGSAVYASGGRFLLIERMTQSKCSSAGGSYQFIDLKTHVRFSLGDLGGIPGDVWLHDAGQGFALGYVDRDTTKVHAVVFEGGKYKRKKSSRASRDTYHELFEEWHINDAMVPRGGGGTVDDPPQRCAAATAEQFATLNEARQQSSSPTAEDADAKESKKKKKKPRAKRTGSKGLGGPADRWLVCELGEGVLAYASTDGDCGKRWEIVVVDGKGKQVARRTDSRAGARVRVRRTDEHEVFVEVGGKDDDVELFSVRTDTIESLGMGSALGVSAPAACRDRCDSPFVNPRAP